MGSKRRRPAIEQGSGPSIDNRWGICFKAPDSTVLLSSGNEIVNCRALNRWRIIENVIIKVLRCQIEISVAVWTSAYWSVPEPGNRIQMRQSVVQLNVAETPASGTNFANSLLVASLEIGSKSEIKA